MNLCNRTCPGIRDEEQYSCVPENTTCYWAIIVNSFDGRMYGWVPQNHLYGQALPYGGLGLIGRIYRILPHLVGQLTLRHPSF